MDFHMTTIYNVKDTENPPAVLCVLWTFL